MAPQYVKPYVKRHKNDRADAEAICEAVQRPSMRFVVVKSEEQQSTLAIHRVRETSPEVRAHLAVAASSLLHAAAGLLDAAAPGNGARGSGGVQKIDLDEADSESVSSTDGDE